MINHSNRFRKISIVKNVDLIEIYNRNISNPNLSEHLLQQSGRLTNIFI